MKITAYQMSLIIEKLPPPSMIEETRFRIEIPQDPEILLPTDFDGADKIQANKIIVYKVARTDGVREWLEWAFEVGNVK